MSVYAVYDMIAQNYIAAFVCSNDADAGRYVRINFAKAPREVLDGLRLVRFGDSEVVGALDDLIPAALPKSPEEDVVER